MNKSSTIIGQEKVCVGGVWVEVSVFSSHAKNDGKAVRASARILED